MKRLVSCPDEKSNMDYMRAVLFIDDNPKHPDGLPQVLHFVPKESPAKRPKRWFGAYGPDYSVVRPKRRDTFKGTNHRSCAS